MELREGRSIESARARGHWFFGALVALFLAACGGASDGTPSGTFEPPVVEYRIVFEDNFDGSELDTTKWTVDEGDGCPDLCGWGNNELQLYSADNITVANGVLTIEGRQEANGSYTSGRINTKDKFDFRYGRIEFRARLPVGQGTWPAMWLLHSDPDVYGPWPASGEIDVVEGFNLGNGNNSIQSTTHYGIATPPFGGTSSQYDLGQSPDIAFHDFALEWERDDLRFFVDGVHYQSQNAAEWYAFFPANEDGFFDPLGAFKEGPRDAPFDQLFHLIINFAIGGNPVGAPDMTTVFPQALEVDYVRVYECVNANPDTGRGCGSGDPSVEILSDNDGNPLQDLETDQPYVESLNLYVDGPETITVNIAGEEASNTLGVNGFTGAGAVVASNPMASDPDDAENTVWQVAISDGVANVYLESQDLTDSELLDTGFDFSGNRGDVGDGGQVVGEVRFDMRVNAMSSDANIVIRLDSGFPNAGEFVLPMSEIDQTGWKTYSVKFDQFVSNPSFVDCCGGGGVDLANILNPFVFEVTAGSVDVLLDNIQVTTACKVVGACGADLQLAGLPPLVVFDDAVNTEIWTRGIVASDSGSGFADYTDPSNPANKVNWAEVAADDPARGNVVEVTFNDSSEFGVFFFGSSGTDVSAYSAGALVFDILVTDYGTNTTGMTAKVDCFFPCTSGDRNLGVIADGVWETVTIPVSQLVSGGLDLSNINTGIVVFPTTPQSGGITFQLDNIRWEAETEAPPLAQIDLPVTFDDPGVNYALIDFGGAGSAVGEDPQDSANMVAVTTKGDGAETFAGTVIGDGSGFANAIPFAAGETTMNLRVLSPAAGIPVLLKVETADASVFAEVQVNTTVADAWETLTFDFSTVGIDLSASYVQAIIFFDFGAMGDDATYYWDDIAFGAPPPPTAPFNLPVNFDAGDEAVIDFGGASTTIGADPDDAGNNVGITVKGAGAETFAGTVIGDGSGFTDGIPFEAGETFMNVRVRAPAAGIPVMLKVENSDGSVFAEVIVNTTVADAWETLVFDFSSVGIDLAASYVQAVIFFDFGDTGDDATYYWDDVQFGRARVDLPVTFDNPGVNYALIDFAGTSSVLAADPDDAGNTVAMTTKSGGEVFAGTVIGDGGGFVSGIPVSASDTTMSVRVRAPAAGIPVLLKIEIADQSVFSEVTVNTTVADAWETLTFDFSSVGIDLSQTYVQAVIFFDFGTVGSGEVYYWDDVEI